MPRDALDVIFSREAAAHAAYDEAYATLLSSVRRLLPEGSVVDASDLSAFGPDCLGLYGREVPAPSSRFRIESLSGVHCVKDPQWRWICFFRAAPIGPRSGKPSARTVSFNLAFAEPGDCGRMSIAVRMRRLAQRLDALPCLSRR